MQHPYRETFTVPPKFSFGERERGEHAISYVFRVEGPMLRLARRASGTGRDKQGHIICMMCMCMNS